MRFDRWGRGGAAASTLLLAGMLLVAPDRTAGAERLKLTPLSFAPSSHASQYSIEEGGLGRLCSLGGAGYFVAPLRLPAGAKIESITAVVADSAPDGFVLMSLVRRRHDDLELLGMTPVSSGGAETETLTTREIRDGIVDAEHAYLLQALLTGPNTCLVKAEVEYLSP